MDITNTTSPPAVGVAVSTATEMSRSLPRHVPAPSDALGLADASDSPAEADGLALADSEGEAEAEAEAAVFEGEAEALGSAAGSDSPPEGQSHAKMATTPSTAAMTRMRRRQYTASGSGPTGFLMLSTVETVNLLHMLSRDGTTPAQGSQVATGSPSCPGRRSAAWHDRQLWTNSPILLTS